MAHTKHLSYQVASLMLLLSPLLLQVTLAQNCGPDAGGALCQSGYCCSNYGYCGTTDDYCAPDNCQSQCPSSPSPPSSPNPPSGGGSGVGSIVTPAFFNQIFPQPPRDPFYAYDAFISAANSFDTVGTTGSSDDQKRDIAALFAHISHETSSLVYIREINQADDYCDTGCDLCPQYPCATGQKYFGRGPLQISWNYNYGPAGETIGQDLLSNPDLVATDPVISFKAALWFWTRSQSSIPSPHDVMTGNYSPSPADAAAGRQPGFGLTIDIVNGGIECGKGPNNAASDRIMFYQNICSILGVDPGTNLDCQNMQPYF